jgi:hypothetical protein
MQTLNAYARSVWNGGALLLSPPVAGISFGDGITRIVLHRAGRFQAELIAFAPHRTVPPHCHPNVDSIDMVVSGQFTVVAGQGVKVRPARPRRSGRSAWFGRFLPIAPETVHGGASGPEGACIISFQHWLQGEPSHIGEDWYAAP